jgi:DNA-binding Lrp family transcriptional regulator
MSPIAYILIDTEYEACDEVLRRLKRTDGVVEAYKIKKGVYGIIAKVHENSDEKLNNTIENIKNIKRIKCTLTQITDDSY